MSYFTASCETAERNTEFAKSLDLDYPILSDPDRKVALEYGLVADKAGFSKRWTFIVGKDGKILHIEKMVDTAAHAEQVAKLLEKLKIDPAPKK